MPSIAPVPLMHGLRRGGHRHVRALMAPLTGREELALQENAGLTPAAQITRILSAATRAIGDVAPVSDDMIRSLTVADRERLLLALHAATFGRRQEMVGPCPSCAAAIEIPLDLTALAEAGCDAGAASAVERDIAIPSPSGPLFVRCRPPNGADQEAAATVVHGGLGAASDALLLACIDAVSDGAGERLEPAGLIDWLREPVEAALQSCDPMGELRLAIICPDCGEEFAAELDAFQLLKATSARRGSVFADVDRLARAYHWSEADILELPLARRRLYLALLAARDDPR